MRPLEHGICACICPCRRGVVPSADFGLCHICMGNWLAESDLQRKDPAWKIRHSAVYESEL